MCLEQHKFSMLQTGRHNDINRLNNMGITSNTWLNHPISNSSDGQYCMADIQQSYTIKLKKKKGIKAAKEYIESKGWLQFAVWQRKGD